MSLGASFPNMTHELIVSKDDDTGNDMTEWIKSVQPGDIITIREVLTPQNSAYFKVIPQDENSNTITTDDVDENGDIIGFYEVSPNVRWRVRLELIQISNNLNLLQDYQFLYLPAIQLVILVVLYQDMKN